MLLMMQLSCSRLLPNQELTTTATPMGGEIILTDTQEVVDNVRALCCEDGWWEHLSDAEYQYSEANDNGEEIDIGAAFLEILEASGKRFDVNKYFNVLTHLAPEDGYLMDYVYFAPGGDGFPQIYTRPESEPSFENYSEYQEYGIEDYLGHIQTDGTAEGFFELAVLNILGEQFYLAWHAEYNDWDVIISQEKMETIIELMDQKYIPLTKEQEKAALKLDLASRVNFVGDKVQVRILVFTKWGGFYERLYTINQDFPHQFIFEDIELIPYNCGILI